jgi:signal transduction histidine kinase
MSKQPEVVESVDSTSIRLLLIEDTTAHRTLIETVLGYHGVHVSSTSSFADAANLLSSPHSFNVILSDLHLPEVNSGEVVSSIRQHAPDLPIVVLTSSRSLTEAVAAMRAGAQDYLVKDFDREFSELLLITLRRVVEQQQRERERKHLEREMKAFQGAVQNGQDGFAIINSKLFIKYANPGFYYFLHEWANSGDAERLEDLETSQPQFVRELRRAVEEMPAGDLWHTELEHTQDQTVRAVSISVSCVPEGEEERVFVLWLKNISDLKRRQRMQRTVVASTTHDLRGPLSTVLLSSRLISERLAEGSDESTRELLARMSTSVERAKAIVDRFLDRQQLEEGVVVLRPEPTEIDKILTAIVFEQNLKQSDRPISMRSDGASSSQVWVVDRIGFQRVAENLLNNAQKFSSPGRAVEVSVEYASEQCALRVRDYGSGIPAHLLSTIFDKGSRLPQHREVPGSGLGLWIVKSIVDAHGGRVEVRSSVNRGTEIAVFFPKNPPVDETGQITLDGMPI